MRRTAADERLEEERGLVDAWQAGDIEAMGLLYERYAPALRAYCVHRLGNRADADDAVHDTFLKAQHGLGSFDPEARLWPWLAAIAAHVCTDNVRRRLRGLNLELHPGSLGDVEEQVAARIRSAIVGDALSSLPPRYRVPLYLKHFVGSTYDEIARFQDRSVGSVRSVLMRGRRHLAHRIEAVARSERQWPLPTSLPALRELRVRVRGLRHRSDHPAQQWLAFQAGWLATAAIGMHIAGAAVAIAVPAVTAPTPMAAVVEAVGSSPQATAPAPSDEVATTVWLPDVRPIAVPATPATDDFRYSVGVDTGDNPVPGGPPLGASVAVRVERDGNKLVISHDYSYTTPVTSGGPVTGWTSWPCFNRPAEDPQRQACQLTVDAFEELARRTG